MFSRLFLSIPVLLALVLVACPPPNPDNTQNKVTVPNVVGISESAARSAISAAGLRTGTVTNQHSATVPVGHVISQTPAAGTRVTPNSAVNLVVSLGPATVPVPNLVNMTLSAAEATLIQTGLGIGTVTENAREDIIEGNVISQSPPADTSVLPGSTVDLVVSTGPSLKASFMVLPSGGPAPLQVEFLYADPLRESEIAIWSWDFDNDGTVDSHARRPIHVYDVPGTYSVKLSIQTLSGETAEYTESDAVVVRAPLPVHLQGRVVIVDDEPSLRLLEKTDTTLTFELEEGASNPIERDDIVIGSDHSDEHGYARRAVEVVQNNNIVVVTTENVSLEDIFEQADISGLLTLTEEDFKKAGFVISPDGTALKSFEDLELHSGVTITGNLSFSPSLDWDCSVSSGSVDYLRCAFAGTLGASFTTAVEIQGAYHVDAAEKTFAKLTKWGWYQIGVVPVLIYAEFEMKAGLEAGLEGGMSLSTGYSTSTTVKFGAEYDKNRSQQWQPILGLDMSPKRIGPEFSTEAGGYLKVYLKPEGKLRLYGVLGPGAAIEPYLRGELQVIPKRVFELKAGIDAEVSFALVDLSAIGVNFDVGFTGELEGPSWVLGRWGEDGGDTEPAWAKPAFRADPTRGYAPLFVTFTDRSTGGLGSVTSWNWNFGDGATSTIQSPTHVYPFPGSYRVTLNVTGSGGQVDWAASQIISVVPHPTRPSVMSFLINSGAPACTSPTVYLNNSCWNNPTEYLASESADFSGASWLPYDTMPTFELSPGLGTKTVYFKVRNAHGESGVVSDSIVRQPIVTSWSKVYSGTGKLTDIQQTADGGYILLGDTEYCPCLVKIDANGNPVWKKVITNFPSLYIGANAVKELSHGDFLVAGTINVDAIIRNEAWLTRTDAAGNILWEKRFGDNWGTSWDYITAFTETYDGQFVLAGYTKLLQVSGNPPTWDQAYLVKTDGSGNILWQRRFPGSGQDTETYDVRETFDHGYILAGASFAGSDNGYLLRTDEHGNKLWEVFFDGGAADQANAVVQADDEEYVFAGGKTLEAFMAKTTASGEIRWEKQLTTNALSEVFDLQRTMDGGFILVGYTRPRTKMEDNDGNDCLIVKANTNGDTTWAKTFGGTSRDVAKAVRQTMDGGYVVGAYTSSFGAYGFDMYVIKLDSAGNAPPTPTREDALCTP